MKPTIYIETTIPSYYYSQRKAAELAVLSKWTREWWDNERQRFELATSVAVLEELENGNHPLKKEKLAMVSGLKQLEVTPEILGTVETYINLLLMYVSTVFKISTARNVMSAKFPMGEGMR